MDTLLQKLKDKLLTVSTQYYGQSLFDNIVKVIQETTNCRMCSLWTINDNSTNDENQKTTSLIVQKLEPQIEYPTNNNTEDYAHDFKKSFISYVLSKINDKSFYYSSLEEFKDSYRSIETLEKLEIKHIISIPIPKQEKKSKNIALLKLYFADNDKPSIAYNSDENYLMFSIIRDIISSCFFRCMLYNKQQIMHCLVENYKNKGSKKNLGDIFYPIIKNILPEHCKCEGVSVFIRNQYMNYFELLSTTNIKGITKKSAYKDVFYHPYEKTRLTSKTIEERRTIIVNNLGNREGKFTENTESEGKTIMLVPIFRLSKREEVIGVLRFVNKQNLINKKVIDFFNDVDKEIIEYASDYLALIIDYFLSEEERNDFIAKLSHEFSSPAWSIYSHAESLIKLKEKKDWSVFEDRFSDYMEGIKSLSKLQLQQAETNLFISKVRVNLPLSKRYEKMGLYNFWDIIQQAKYMVNPFAITKGVALDNIKIDVGLSFLDWELYIDKTAFTTIFYNLLTNAIKYRNPTNNNISVNIIAEKVEDWLIVNVSDFGLGINPLDEDKIFLMGFRGDNVTKYETGGFGIGLPVVMQIIKDFGGKICVSNFQNPTTFEIKLPNKLFNDKYTKKPEWNSAK